MTEHGETEQARAAHRRYIVEFAGSMAAYLAVMLVIMPVVRGGEDSPWRLPLMLLPLVPIALMVWVLVRHYRRVDEMVRRAIIESLAFAFILSAPIVITLGFLESAGVELSIWWAWVSMGAAWFLGGMLLRLRYR